MKLKEKKYGIIISSGVSKSGKIPFFVRNRLDQAFNLYQIGLLDKIIVSGGKHFNSNEENIKDDAFYLHKYLKNLGVDEKDIISETHSKDLLSASYFIKTLILLPNKINKVVIFASDFEEERLRFTFHKIFGEDIAFSINLSHSQVKSEILWNIFYYERQSLSAIKSFLRKMKIGEHLFLKNIFYSSSLYRKRILGYTRELVHHDQIGKRRQSKAHYSMSHILRKRSQIFKNFGIEDLPKKILMADFWSGRFLNFFGRDFEGTLYCLKFVLYVKDKKTFLNEVNITNHLVSSGAKFIPIIIAQSQDRGAPWYLYKVVKGKNAGHFSYHFSFNDNFYLKNPAKIISNNLRSLRKIEKLPFNLPVKSSVFFKNASEKIVKKLLLIKNLPEKKLIEHSYNTLLSELKKINNNFLYINHADLHPANIIVSNNKIYLIDFEHTCMSFIAFDFAFITVFAWNNKEFQDKFTKYFIKSLTEAEKKDFDLSWPAMNLYMNLFLLRFTYVWEYKSGKENANIARKNIYQNLNYTLSLITK